MNKRFFLLFIFCSLLTLSMAEKIIDGVVWVVGDQAILLSEVEEERLRAQYQGMQVEGNPFCVIPEQIAVRKLFLHQAEMDSVEANPGQVEMQVNAQFDYYLRQIGSRDKVEEYFKKSSANIKDELRQNLSERMIVETVQQSLIKDIKVTPSEIRSYYNELPSDSIPVVPATVEVQILTLEPPIPVSEIEATKNTLRGFAKRVNTGDADFSMLARLYSADTESAKHGGELGFMPRGSLVKEFADAAFDLTTPGQVSRVVKTEFGYHIIQLIEKRDDRVNVRHILLHPHVTSEIQQTTLLSLDSIATSIRTNKISFTEACSLYSSDKDTRLNGGMMTNQKAQSAFANSSYFEFQDLPSEIAKVAYDMKVGEVSKAFSMYDDKLGREVFVLIRLQDKRSKHKANLKEDYNMLKDACESKKKNDTLQDWIKSKIKDTYIYITPEWQNCDYRYDGWIKKD